MKIVILVLVILIGKSWASSACSTNFLDDISPDLKAAYDEAYPNAYLKAQTALDTHGGKIAVGNKIFTNVDDYARWISRMEATKIVSKTRVLELDDVIRGSWKKNGYSDAQIDAWMRKLQQKVNSGSAVWDNGKFRYISKEGDALGANLLSDDLQRALASAQGEIAGSAAKIGDQGAQELVNSMSYMSKTRDALAEQARLQGWSVTNVRGHTAIEIRNIDTSTSLGKKLMEISQWSSNRKVVMSFSNDATSVSFHLVGSDGKLTATVKRFSGTEFYNQLFK